MNRKRLLLATAFLIGLSMIGFAVGTVHYPAHSVNVGIGEPLTISPLNQTVSLFPGECKPLNWTITNAANATVEVYFAINGNGNGSLTISPSTGEFNATPGPSVLTVTVCASNGAVPGTYVVVADFERF